MNRFTGLKILRHYPTLESVLQGGMPFPLDWHIYPSNICNHKCTFCMFRQPSGGDGKVEQFDFAVKLDKNVLFRGVEDAYRTGAVLIHFSGGGEPLQNRWTLPAMELAQELIAGNTRDERERGPMKITLTTNGARLSEDVARTVDYLRISLNAGTKHQHWATNHGSDEKDPGDWEKILENVKAAAKVKRGDIGLAFVVTPENWRDVYPFCQVAAECGVDFVHIRPGFFYDESMNEQMREIIHQAFALSEEAKSALAHKVQIFSLTDKFDGYWTPRTYKSCRAVLTGVTLRATGDFAVCQDRPDLTFGTQPNYALGATFEDVWHSDQHKAVVATIVEGQQLDKCPRCVWNNRNMLLDALEKDSMRMNLI